MRCGAGRLARQLGVPVLTAPGTWARLGLRMRHAEHRALGLCTQVKIGPFSVTACPTSHDAAEPLALAVECADGTRVGVAYDLGRPTAAVRYLLRDLTAIVLEANYDDMLLRTSSYPPVVQRRIAGSAGHLSNRAAAELLAEAAPPRTRRRGAGAPEPGVQHGGRRARRRGARPSAGGVRGRVACGGSGPAAGADPGGAGGWSAAQARSSDLTHLVTLSAAKGTMLTWPPSLRSG